MFDSLDCKNIGNRIIRGVRFLLVNVQITQDVQIGRRWSHMEHYSLFQFFFCCLNSEGEYPNR